MEKLRAQIITSELLSVDYSESELAYERSVLSHPVYNCLKIIGGPISDISDIRRAFSKGALFFRWLKQKNQRRRAESREKVRKRQEDREEMKTVLNNIKTR